MPDMYGAKKPIMVAGIIMLVTGFVFMLQGEGTVGPESSFMYSNPEWYTNGKAIMLVGGATCVGAMFIRRSGEDYQEDSGSKKSKRSSQKKSR